jgi:hypothetical protein
MKTKFAWAAIIVVSLAGGFVLLRQYESQVRLHAEVEKLGKQNVDRTRLREANRQLAETLPSAAERERLRADHAAISQLRGEIAALKAREKIAAEELAQRSAQRFAAGDKVVAGEWSNAGAATSRAALETILWAAAGGDIDAFAKCLLLSDRTRQLALQLLEGFPAALREQNRTPEQLIAFLACKDVPLGAANVVAWNQVRTKTTMEQVRLQLSAPDGTTKDLLLSFAQQSDGWKLVVPDVAIAKYVALLKGTSTATVVKGSAGTVGNK